MNTSIQQRIVLLIAAILALFVMSSANASLITVNLTGSVTDWDGGLGAQFSVGDTLNMHYSYDSEAVDSQSASSSGVYALSDYSGTMGSYVFNFISGNITLYPNTTTFGDQIFVTGYLSGSDVAGASLVLGSAWFRDFDDTLLADDSLITTAPDLSVLEAYGFFLRFDIDEEVVIVRANIDSATWTQTSVPEPASYALLLMGLLSLSMVRRQKA